MSTVGERKCALLLSSLHKRDRQRLLARLPAESARVIRTLVTQLEALPLPIADLAQSLLGDEVRGLTARTSLDLEQLVDISRRLSPEWFARVLSVWTGVNRTFCVALLDADVAAEVKRELAGLRPIPPKLVEAMKAEVLALAIPRKEAA